MTNFWGNCYFGVVYALDCFHYFCYMDGHFTGFMGMGDFIALPRCMDFYNLGGLGVS